MMSSARHRSVFGPNSVSCLMCNVGYDRGLRAHVVLFEDETERGEES